MRNPPSPIVKTLKGIEGGKTDVKICCETGATHPFASGRQVRRHGFLEH